MMSNNDLLHQTYFSFLPLIADFHFLFVSWSFALSLAWKRIHPFAWCVKQLKGVCQEFTFGGDPEQHHKLNKIKDCHLHGTSWDIA